MTRLKNIDKDGVSVVMVCFNSITRIAPTLQHLVQQREIDFGWEVVLVDNASTDGTAEFVRKFWAEHHPPCPLRVVTEDRKGTMIARQTGILSASFRYLLFCDDDNWLEPSYLKNAYHHIRGNDSIAAVGGIGQMTFDSNFKTPIWSANFMKSYGCGPQGKTDGDTTFGKGCLYTAGAIIDRAWLSRLYDAGFSSSLKGRDGKSLVAGEDTELTYALKLIGGKLHYSSLMRFEHYMPPGRMNWNYLKRLWRSFGYSDFLLSPYKSSFAQSSPKGFIPACTIQLWLVTKYFLRALIATFSEGEKSVLEYERAKGRLNACLSDFARYKNNVAIVEQLLVNHTKQK